MQNIKAHALRDARKLYDIKDILGMTTRKNTCICPLPSHRHAANTPSFSVFFDKQGVQRWHCHGSCGLRGDVIDLVGFMKIANYNPDNKEHVARALTLLETGQQISIPVRGEDKVATLDTHLWKEFLPVGKEVSEYLVRRGITPKTMVDFGFGQMTTSPEGYNIQPYTTWLTMPTFTGPRMTKLKMRNIYSEGKNDRYKAFTGSILGLHNYNNVLERTEPVLVVKGEISVALLSQFGILACAPNAGEGATEEWMYLALAFARKIVVIGDNDPEPIMEQTRLLLEKRARILHAEAKLPPNQFHDVDDWVNGDPNAIATIKGWLR